MKNERDSDHFNQSQLLADAKLKLKTTPVKTLVDDMDHINKKESVCSTAKDQSNQTNSKAWKNPK